MYYLFSPQIIVDNIIALSSPFIIDKKDLNFSTLKQAYRAYLKKIQPYCPLIDNDQLFYADSETEQLFNNYFAQSEIDMTKIYEKIEIDNVMYPDAQKRCAVLQKAFSRMVSADPIFADIFSLVMNTVFCTVSKNLGSTSINPKYLGVMCAHHDMHGVEEIIPELLIHEFTHNAILLDEHRYGHYKNYELLENPQTQLDATDRGVYFKFPLNRVLHSMLVAAEVIMLRNAYVGHVPRPNQHLKTSEIIARSKKYIATIDANTAALEILTERGLILYNKVRDFFVFYK